MARVVCLFIIFFLKRKTAYEMRISDWSSDVCSSDLQRFVSDYKPETASREEVGTVAEAGDGIARVSGLPSVMANELLEFEDGTRGLALNLDTRDIGVVVLGDFAGTEEGKTVRTTGEVISVPVGDGYLGCVGDPSGQAVVGWGAMWHRGGWALNP